MLLAAAQRGPADEYVRIERLSDRVLLVYWLGTGRCNLTAIKSEKGLVIVDTEMSPRIMAPIKARIEKEFGRGDWVYVINTHAHVHHAGGNSLFPGAVIVGHENLPKDMEWLVRRQADPESKRRDLERSRRTVQNLAAALHRFRRNSPRVKRILGEIEFYKRYIQDVEEGFEIVRPSLTFADRHTLELGDLTLELVFFGKGHSTSDILVYLPQERLLVTGAIAYQRRHLPEIGEETELQELHRPLAVLDEFVADDIRIDHVVPSHSPILLKSDLLPVREYYRKMLAAARAARKEGLTLEQAYTRMSVRNKFPEFREPPPDHWAYGMQERNIRNLWRILQNEERRARENKIENTKQ
jgi:glyoxylase-like metal-dependent hydrolase (beta-lactamase superfamily II)